MRKHVSQAVTSKVLFVLVVQLCAGWVLSSGSAISVSVREQGGGRLLPCRAWVEAQGKRLFDPVGQTCTPYPRDRSFSCGGKFVIEVGAGKVIVHVERGKEYYAVDREVVVPADGTVEVAIELERWVNMVEAGWYSGDIHCHFGADSIETLKELALADDVNYEPVLSLWNQLKTKSAQLGWGEYAGRPDIYADSTHVVTLRNIEIERIGGKAFESVGALLMFGLAEPVEIPPVRNKYPCDAMLLRMAKATTPDCVIDTDKPIWGENVVGVALGLFDSVQVCHNHYHRERTIPWGWGMARPGIEDEEKGLAPDELFHLTNSTYYRFLNCGFKLAATGGSAMGVMPVPLGYNRTYAKLDGPLCEANYLKAIRAGRTFATSGPMLILTADGRDCGAAIQYARDGRKEIRVKAQLSSIEKIDSLELIQNGEIVKRIDLAEHQYRPMLKAALTAELKPNRSGWLIARAIFKGPDGRLRQAHTSPVYIIVDGKEIASKKDADFMIRWIDRLLEISSRPARYESDNERRQIQAIFKQARRVYEEIAKKASAQ